MLFLLFILNQTTGSQLAKQLSFTNWNPAEPDDYKGQEDCAIMEDSGLLDNGSCDDRHHMCEINNK